MTVILQQYISRLQVLDASQRVEAAPGAKYNFDRRPFWSRPGGSTNIHVNVPQSTYQQFKKELEQLDAMVDGYIVYVQRNDAYCMGKVFDGKGEVELIQPLSPVFSAFLGARFNDIDVLRLDGSHEDLQCPVVAWQLYIYSVKQ